MPPLKTDELEKDIQDYYYSTLLLFNTIIIIIQDYYYSTLLLLFKTIIIQDYYYSRL